MDLLTQLRKSLKQKQCVRFRTSHPEQDYYDGIVTHVRPDYIVLCQEDDFEFDGVVVLNRKAITACDDQYYGKVFNAVLRNTGQLAALKAPAWLDDCRTFEDVFTQLKRRRIWPAVKIVHKKDGWFFIGQITHVEENGSVIRHYDGNGKWEDDDAPFGYQNLHCIHFGDRYTKHFNSYMRKTG